LKKKRWRKEGESLIWLWVRESRTNHNIGGGRNKARPKEPTKTHQKKAGITRSKLGRRVIGEPTTMPERGEEKEKAQTTNLEKRHTL